MEKIKNKNKVVRRLKRARFGFFVQVFFIDLIIVLLTYILMPIVQNFPPLGEDLEFQRLVQPLTHLQQYFIVFSIGLLVHFISFKVLLRKINVYLKAFRDGEEISVKQVFEVRKACQNIPYTVLLIQLLLFIPLGIIFNMIMLIQMVAIIKFTMMVVALTSMVSVLTFVATQRYLTIILLTTYDITGIYKNDVGLRVNNTRSLMMQMIPFIAVVLIILSLIGYSKAVDQKEIASSNYYRAYFENMDLETSEIDKEYLIKKLQQIKPEQESHYSFILDSNGEVVYLSNPEGNVDKFAFYYKEFFFKDFEEGTLYERFGVDERLYTVKVTNAEGDDWYFGYKFGITDQPLLLYYFTLIIVLVNVFGIILYIWARNHSINLQRVSDNLKRILENEDVDPNDIVPVVSNDEIGDLSFYYNKIQRKLIDQQDVIKQQGQLVSLGQMIGGIAHNLKTPILSIAGAAEGIQQLADEMDESLVTPTVTLEDKKEIIKEQEEWVEKIKIHLEYMNDVITAVKGQATTFTTERNENFSVKDLFKNVEILTSHEFKNALAELNIINNVPENIHITGDFNSLLQIINNIVVNAIQSYDEQKNKVVDLIANVGNESGDIVISIRDYGKGMSEDTQSKIFKQMVTTKGKYGTGLGLYMSYSTIKGKFHGDIKFESQEGKGTIFHVAIPNQATSKVEPTNQPAYISDMRPITEARVKDLENSNKTNEEKKLKKDE